MKLQLADLHCRRLELSNGEQPPTVLELENISEGTGLLEFRDGLSLIKEIAIRKLLAALEIPIAGGCLRTEHPATIEHVSCGGRIRNGFTGELRSSIVSSDRVSLSLSSVNAVAQLVAEGLHLKIDGRGGLIEVGTLSLSNAQCTVGALLLRLGSLTISGLVVRWEADSRPLITAIKASARDLAISYGSTSLSIDVIDLSEGLQVDERVRISTISVASVQFSVDELAPGNRDTRHSESSSTERSSPTLELDHGVFETVNGYLKVDATMSASLPVIGKRTATHHFRIPVDGGIIDYRDFEKGLSDLEDAFIDIRVRGDQLVLERDIPLIPGLQKPIVTWALAAGERELAAQRLVRIGTLLNYEIAGEADEDEEPAKKSKVRLHRLDFDNIEVRFFLDEGAVLRSGAGSLRAHVDELLVTGSLHFDPDPEDPVAATTIEVCGKGLGTAAEDLLIFGHRLAAGVSIGSVEKVAIEFDELTPTKMVASLKNVSVSDVDFDLRPVTSEG